MNEDGEIWQETKGKNRVARNLARNKREKRELERVGMNFTRRTTYMILDTK